MLILAMESSAKPVSVAVYETSGVESLGSVGPADTVAGESYGRLLGQYFQNNGFSHSRTLMSMAESLLDNLGLKPVDINLVAVASGPGSFTGVRIGVSAAKGFAWGLDIPVCGVSTLEAMAMQTSEADAIICPVMDARREQVYNALFRWQDGGLERLCDDRAISIKELAADLNAWDICSAENPAMLVGDGVDVCMSGFAALDSSASFERYTAAELVRFQTAFGVALAAVHKKPVLATDLEPSYLRPSQAERERSQSSNNSSS
ncbi:MAG: tRNA (adenosine(37)-N6)-threonylcarbamoyltransferase complex dimerization subunit type 1 TsaB [Oscillospiraceae bacterium]|nr:tRNA (adenosine(37)-N6)-threonylcarbamoyltransferase complex dimerization subunit type 1 TsaB [Oscillospiraceae bacterium]